MFGIVYSSDSDNKIMNSFVDEYEVWCNEGKNPDIASIDLDFALDLQKKRLDEKGVRIQTAFTDKETVKDEVPVNACTAYDMGECKSNIATKTYDVPEEHRCRRQEQTHPQAEEEEGDERVERFQKGQVERRTGKDHHQQQGHKAEHAVHHGKAALFQREDILGDIHLFQQGGSAEHAAHAGGGGLVEEVEEQLTAHQEHREVVDAAAPHIHQAAEHSPVDQAHQQGVQHAPQHTQHAAAVFQLEITADQIPQQIAVAPEAVEHSFQFRHGLSPLFKEFKLLGCKGLMQLVLCAGLVLTAAVGPLHVHGGVIVGDAALAGGVIDIGALVAELGHIAQHQEAVGKALGDIEHLLVLLAQGHAHPLAKGGAVGAAVHGHIVHLALGHAHQLALGVVLLEVQPAQHAPGGAALVVLHKFLVDTGLCELVLLVGLHKIAAVVAEHLRLNDHHAGDLGLRKNKLTHDIVPLFFSESFFFIWKSLVLNRLLRFFMVPCRFAALFQAGMYPQHQYGNHGCTYGAPHRDARQQPCAAARFHVSGGFQLCADALLQQFRQTCDLGFYPHAGALLLCAAVQGVHRIHGRLCAKQILLRQLQVHGHVLRG